MRITSGRISVTVHTEQDIRDVCRVLNTQPWSEAEIAIFERLIAEGVGMIDAMRRVDDMRKQRAS